MSIIGNVSNTKGKILIIDDEDDVREVIKLHLDSSRFNVIEARDGEEAIGLMKDGSNLLQVGLIICDIRMPKINGVEAIDYLLENAGSIPILVITGYPDAELAVSLLDKGVSGYLVKPVEKDTLLSKVEEITSKPHNFDNLCPS